MVFFVAAAVFLFPFPPNIGQCAGKILNMGATELTLKVLLLVSRNWKKRKAKKKKKDRKLRKNGEKERGSVKGNENGIGIVTGQRREIETGIEKEIVTAIGNGVQIAIRIGVDQGKAS